MLACKSVVPTTATGCNNNDVVEGGGGEEDWMTILPILMAGHEGTHHHLFKVSKEATLRMIVIGGVTHLRLNNFPDGEMAKIRA
jgi:allantoicase